VRLVRGAEPVDRFGRSLARVQVLEGPLAGRDLSRSVAEQGLARPLSIEPTRTMRRASPSSCGVPARRGSACGAPAASRRRSRGADDAAATLARSV